MVMEMLVVMLECGLLVVMWVMEGIVRFRGERFGIYGSTGWWVNKDDCPEDYEEISNKDDCCDNEREGTIEPWWRML